MYKYKGSTFGQTWLPSSAKRAHTTTSPLNPWFLSNGFPDFSPQIDKNYDALVLKRKNAANDNTTINDGSSLQHESANEENPSKKVRSVASPDVQQETIESNLIDEGEKSVAQSLLNSIQVEKRKSKMLEEKIMSSMYKKK